MDLDDGNRTSAILQRILTVRIVVPMIFGFTVAVSLASVGIAEAVKTALGRNAADVGQTGQVFESVAAIFSGLAFVALVVTFQLQLEELRLQRRELENQRLESGRVQARQPHIELLKMSIGDSELAEVWPDPGVDVPYAVRRKYWYANLIYQHQRLATELSGLGDAQSRVWLLRMFKSPIMLASEKSCSYPARLSGTSLSWLTRYFMRRPIRRCPNREQPDQASWLSCLMAARSSSRGMTTVRSYSARDALRSKSSGSNSEVWSVTMTAISPDASSNTSGQLIP